RTCVLMHKFYRQCNASQSITLHDTTLRKHVATHCIQFDLNVTDVSDIAIFMSYVDE
ncbi:hypothetical protein EAG_10973, partial [Camponotus floridanus]